MHRFLHALKAHAELSSQTTAQPRFATITSYNAANATARVLLQPEGTLSGWLPVLSAWSGNGWGMVCPLAAGDQVVVIAQEGEAAHGIIVGRAFSSTSPPPQAPSGECWLVHPSGAAIKLQRDGTVAISGDLHVTGDIYDRHGSLDHLRAAYNSHTHTTSGGAATSGPNLQD